MARLRFVPRAGIAVPYPGRGPGDNHHAGRALKGANGVVDPKNPVGHLEVGLEYEAPEPIDVLAGTPEAHRFIEFCKRDGDVHPFDAETAKAIGVPFVPVERGEDGEWYPAKPKAAKPTEERKAV